MNLVTVREYAELCEASTQTVYNKIASGAIKPSFYRSGATLIDADIYPPVKVVRGRPFKKVEKKSK